MGRRKKKSNSKLLLRWVIALSAVLILMAALAVTLKQCAPVPERDPIDTTPSTPGANPFAPTDFVRSESGYLTCLTAKSIPGIDVSSHQGQIDWPSVKASGIEFAIIRLGYRGYDSGTLHVDERAQQNLAGAKAAGLKVGAYFFSQALTAEEAKAEARLALKVLDGTALDLPLVYDWEYVAQDARTGSMDNEMLMQCVHTFCGEVNRAGYQPMVYFNQDLAKTRLDLDRLSCYPFWLALYSDELTYPYEIRFWQYSDQGSVPGIEGNVDLDLYFP